jgi:transcriptional regulator with XRE-family HTH domain
VDADPVRLAVGQAVRDARLRSGMSMRSLAARCGVSQAFLSAVERGMSTPSIITLYKLAEVLGTEPADLLAPPDDRDVSVVRADEGRLVPTSDRPGAALGRVIFSDPRRHLEIYEYCVTVNDDLDVWYEHPGATVLHLIEGRLEVEFESRPTVVLGPGDCIVHHGAIAHRWTIVGSEPVRLFLVVVRSEPGEHR